MRPTHHYAPSCLERSRVSTRIRYRDRLLRTQIEPRAGDCLGCPSFGHGDPGSVAAVKWVLFSLEQERSCLCAPLALPETPESLPTQMRISEATAEMRPAAKVMGRVFDAGDDGGKVEVVVEISSCRRAGGSGPRRLAQFTATSIVEATNCLRLSHQQYQR